MALQTVVDRTRETATAPGGSRGVDRDSELLKALRRREPLAAERLVVRYGDRAYRLAKSITGNGSDAEEVVQDAFWTVVRKIDMFRGDSAFGSWLYRIVANAACQKTRRARARPRDLSWDDVLPVFDEHGHHAVPLADWSPRVTNPARQTELRDELTRAIDALPETHRMALVLHDVEGLAHPEIAQALDITIALVKARVHRARLFLRKHLDQAMTAPRACA